MKCYDFTDNTNIGFKHLAIELDKLYIDKLVKSLLTINIFCIIKPYLCMFFFS